MTFRTDKNRKEELELRKHFLTKYFPDWPIDILLENRAGYLKDKDCGSVRCVGRKNFDDGYIYQFEFCSEWKMCPFGYQPFDLGGGLFTSIGGDGPNEDGYWCNKGFFRGWISWIRKEFQSTHIAFIEIPDPDIWLKEANCGRYTTSKPGSRKRCRDYQYSLIKVSGILGDLEFATLSTKYDFIVSETDGFYHDMMVHVGRYIKYDYHCETKKLLSSYLDSYEKFSQKSPLLEYIFGYAADTSCPFAEWSDKESGSVSRIKKVSLEEVKMTLKTFLNFHER